MPAKIKTDEKIYRKFCAHCLNKEQAPRGKKETPEEKRARELRNDENTLIYEVRTVNGKVVETKGALPFNYDGQPYHEECLLEWLRHKLKKDNEKINAAYEDSVRRRNKMIDASRKKGKLCSSEMKSAKTTRSNRERLINYFMGHYGASVISKKVQTTIKDLDEGKSKTYNNIVIHYDKLLDMFLYYEDELMGIYKSKIKTGNAPTNASQRILYDISVVVLNIDEYNSRKEVRYIQQDQKSNEELLDVKKYIRPVVDTGKDKEIDIDKEMIKEFVEEMSKNEDDEYITSIFSDDIFKD